MVEEKLCSGELRCVSILFVTVNIKENKKFFCPYLPHLDLEPHLYGIRGQFTKQNSKQI